MRSPEDYTFKHVKITWCPGCGNYAVLTAVKMALAELDIEPEKLVILSGIGCHGRIASYIKANSFHVIHGRVLPVAIGIKLANPELTVIGFAGDGDAYAIGIGHLPHAARRNVDITYIVHNNAIFALTTGQASPTTFKGARTRSTPHGNPEEPLNPILLALASGATFVARGFAGDVQHLKKLIVEAIKHRGFSFIDVILPCVVFSPYGRGAEVYAKLKQKIYKLESVGHDPTNFEEAFKRALETDRIPIGVFYKAEKSTFEDSYKEIYRKIGAPVFADIRNIDVSKLLEEKRYR